MGLLRWSRLRVRVGSLNHFECCGLGGGVRLLGMRGRAIR